MPDTPVERSEPHGARDRERRRGPETFGPVVKRYDVDPAGGLILQEAPADNWPAPKGYGGAVVGKRRSPGKRERTRILERQGNACLYCERPFGTPFLRQGRLGHLRLHWDHVIPFSYSLKNDADNFVAACHVCNLIKGDLMFNTLYLARKYINNRIARKRYFFG